MKRGPDNFRSPPGSTFWIVRSGKPTGRYASDFIKNGWIGVGWLPGYEITSSSTPQEVLAWMEREHPEATRRALIVQSGQLARFASAMSIGDPVAVYVPSERRYVIGTVRSDVSSANTHALPHTRRVTWTHQASRDELTTEARRSLASGLTLFGLPSPHAEEVAAKSSPLEIKRPAVDRGQMIADGNPAQRLYDFMDFLRNSAHGATVSDVLVNRYAIEHPNQVLKIFFNQGVALLLATEEAVKQAFGEDSDYLDWRDETFAGFAHMSLSTQLHEFSNYVTNETMLHLHYCAKAMSNEVARDGVDELLGMIQEFRAKVEGLHLDRSVAAYVEDQLAEMERVVVGQAYGTVNISELMQVAISIAETLRGQSLADDETSCLTELIELAGRLYQAVKGDVLQLAEHLPKLLSP